VPVVTDSGARAAVWAAIVVGSAALGAATAVVYALLFEYVTRRAGWRVGAVVGALHGATLAVAAGFLPWLAERAGYALDAAPFGVRHGTLALAALVAAGVVFGMIVGGCYGAPRHAPDAVPRVWWRERYPTSRRFQ
jgi:hypothetical protein